MAAEPLGPGAVYRRCSFADAPFETTDDLEPLGAPIAHDRAVRALHVATALRGTGRTSSPSPVSWRTRAA